MTSLRKTDLGEKNALHFSFLFFFFLHTFAFQLLENKPWSQVSSLLPPRFLPSIFIAHRVQQSRIARRFCIECC